MKIVRKFFELKRASVFLISGSYLSYNIEKIIHSSFFSFYQLLYTLLVILIIDFLIKFGNLKINPNLRTSFSLFSVFFFILFYFGFYFVTFIQETFQQNFHILIRGRIIFECFILMFILITILFKKKKINFKYLNIFFILFSVISIFGYIINTKTTIKNHFKSGFIKLSNKNISTKPILLIISDEYASPDELYNIYKDSSIYKFSNKLTSKGWITKNSFYSFETSTIHSVGSLFNFNLSKNKGYKNEKITNIATSKIVKANISDSLENKKVDIINFGIFHMGKYSYLNRLYLYPTSFFEDIMMNTIYYIIKSNTGNFRDGGMTNSYYPMEDHNKYIFNNLLDTLNSINNPKTFIYAHLYMPHSPMQFNPSFPLRPINNINNYKDYWIFTNKKIDTLLTSLIKDNYYKIILWL